LVVSFKSRPIDPREIVPSTLSKSDPPLLGRWDPA
jgi:hypothetical protein